MPAQEFNILDKESLKLYKQLDDYKAQIDNLNFVIAKINKLSNFYSKIESTDSIAEIFNFFVEELKSLFIINYIGLLLLSKDDVEFELVAAYPENKKQECLDKFNQDVESGVFGWAIIQNKFSVLPSKEGDKANGAIPDYEVLTIVFPLKRNKRIFGSLISKIHVDRSSLSTEQQAYLSIISKQLTLALGNAIYLDQINSQKNVLEKYKKKIDKELVAAKKIQQSIIPAKFPSVSGVSFRSIYLPYEKIGGDFYDVIKITDKRFVAVIADVSGHGVPAALGTAALKSAIYSSINPMKFEPEQAIRDLHKSLNHSFNDEQFATMFLGDFDLILHRLTYYSFGHLPVLHYKLKQNRIEYLKASSGCIGMFNKNTHVSETIKFEKGDSFFLLTDGVVECVDSNENIFGFENVVDVIKTTASEFVIDSLLREMRSFSSGEFDDDVAILQLNIL